MNTKLLMTGSAITLGAAGVAASFLPHEILQSLNVSSAGLTPLLVQIIGAAYLGFGMMNWMLKGTLIGGIYNRPTAMANMLHFFVGAMALIKVAGAQQSVLIWTATAVYGVFAVLYSIVFFSHPVKES